MKKTNRKKTGTLGYLTIFVLVVVLMITGAGSIFLAVTISKTPAWSSDKVLSKESTKIYDKDGVLVAEMGSQLRDNVTYDQLPQVVIDAFIATEDSRFFEHNGFDIARFIKSFIENIKSKSFAQGGSTITMQLIKKSYFETPESLAEKSITRKIKEIILALQAETEISKEDILTMYLNKIDFGDRKYGIQSAARHYFGKEVEELTLPEAALLAGVINATTSYNPYNNLELATKRQHVVIDLMTRHGYISEQDADLAKSIPLENLLVGRSEDADSEKIQYQSYIDLVYQEAKKLTGLDPTYVPMNIYTNMDSKAQAKIEEIVDGPNIKYPTNDDLYQIGFAAIENSTGKIIAVSGGRNYTGQLVYNRAYDMKKQPGSTAKPILVYGPAFDHLGISTVTTLEDKPTFYRGTDILLNNYDRRFRGQILVSTALIDSRNTTAYQLYQKLADTLGLESLVEHMNNLGFNESLDTFKLGNSIGAFTNGISPVQLAGAYTIFGNEGRYIEPHAIEKIELTESGNVIEPVYTPNQVISEEAAFLTSDILYKLTSASGSYMNVLYNKNFKVYTKSGTTDYGSEGAEYGIPEGAKKDIWAAAYTSEISVAVWNGYDKPIKGKETYITSAKQSLNAHFKIAKEFIFYYHQNNYPKDIEKPLGVASISLVKGTDYAPALDTPSNYIVNGYVKAEYKNKETISPDPIQNLTNFDWSYDPLTSNISLQYEAYPNEEATKLASTTINYEVNINGSNKVFTGSRLFDKSWIYGPIKYGFDLYVDDVKIFSNSSSESSYSLPLINNKTSEVKVCGFYKYDLNELKSNEICKTLTIEKNDNWDPVFPEIPDLDDLPDND